MATGHGPEPRIGPLEQTPLVTPHLFATAQTSHRQVAASPEATRVIQTLLEGEDADAELAGRVGELRLALQSRIERERDVFAPLEREAREQAKVSAGGASTQEKMEQVGSDIDELQEWLLGLGKKTVDGEADEDPNGGPLHEAVAGSLRNWAPRARTQEIFQARHVEKRINISAIADALTALVKTDSGILLIIEALDATEADKFDEALDLVAQATIVYVQNSKLLLGQPARLVYRLLQHATPARLSALVKALCRQVQEYACTEYGSMAFKLIFESGRVPLQNLTILLDAIVGRFRPLAQNGYAHQAIRAAMDNLPRENLKGLLAAFVENATRLAQHEDTISILKNALPRFGPDLAGPILNNAKNLARHPVGRYALEAIVENPATRAMYLPFIDRHLAVYADDPLATMPMFRYVELGSDDDLLQLVARFVKNKGWLVAGALKGFYGANLLLQLLQKAQTRSLPGTGQLLKVIEQHFPQNYDGRHTSHRNLLDCARAVGARIQIDPTRMQKTAAPSQSSPSASTDAPALSSVGPPRPIVPVASRANTAAAPSTTPTGPGIASLSAPAATDTRAAAHDAQLVAGVGGAAASSRARNDWGDGQFAPGGTAYAPGFNTRTNARDDGVMAAGDGAGIGGGELDVQGRGRPGASGAWGSGPMGTSGGPWLDRGGGDWYGGRSSGGWTGGRGGRGGRGDWSGRGRRGWGGMAPQGWWRGG